MEPQSSLTRERVSELSGCHVIKLLILVIVIIRDQECNTSLILLPFNRSEWIIIFKLVLSTSTSLQFLTWNDSLHLLKGVKQSFCPMILALYHWNENYPLITSLFLSLIPSQKLLWHSNAFVSKKMMRRFLSSLRVCIGDSLCLVFSIVLFFLPDLWLRFSLQTLIDCKWEEKSQSNFHSFFALPFHLLIRFPWWSRWSTFKLLFDIFDGQ